MSESLSEADRIRNKRLAKLGNTNAQTASDSENHNHDAATPSSPQHRAPGDGSPTTSSMSSLAAPAQQQPKSSGELRRPINITSSSAYTPQTNIRASPPAQRPSSRTTATESTEDWVDKTLGSLFKITLKEHSSKEGAGIRDPYYLSELASDLQQDGLLKKVNISLLDQALVEAASNQPSIRPFDLFLASYKRVIKMIRSKGSTLDQKKVEVLKEAKRICMSYCIFAVTLPDMFGQLSPTVNPLVQNFLADPDSDTGLCYDFLTDAIARFPEDEAVKETLVQAVDHLSFELSTKSMNDDYKPYLTAMLNLVRHPRMVIAMAESSRFLPPNLPAQDVEKHTLLGPFFQLSPLQGEVASNFFSNPRTRDRGFIIQSQNALRMTLQQLQIQLFDIIDRFIKVSKESREKTLDWFALIVNLNHKRRAMRTDPRYVSSDGFMVNVTTCLDRLSEPFMDANFSKVSRIEPEYLRRNPRVDISDETKINADQSESDNFYNSKVEGSSNFISEVFFLTVAAHHYGTEAANTKLGDLRRQLKYLDKELERFEGEREKFATGPQHVLALFEARLKKMKEQADRGHCVLHATEGILLDEQLQARAMSFMRYVIVWLLRLVSNTDFPKTEFTLPLPNEQPNIFKCLPEYFIEDIVDHFKFMTSHMPHVVTPTQCQELVTICITFLRSSEYIKNPYLKAGLVTILYYGVMRVGTLSNGILGNVLNSMPFALSHLLRAVMQFYIECESTGAHTQFYDKFNIRYEISKIIQCIWGNVTYREQLGKQAAHNSDFFVRFVNLLMNDVTFVLDESFSAFQQIVSLTTELESQQAATDETARQQKEEALEAAQNKAKSYMSLTTETMSMLKLFTDALADSFTMPEIVQRLADMLDYNLEALVGPKQKQLKVQNRGDYNFDPLMLLSDLTDVFLNLSHKRSFQLAIARDARSYKPETFAQARQILLAKNRKSAEELKRWDDFAAAIAKVKAEDEEEEQDIGEFPDEFTDPIMGILMRDPVLLPSSRNVVDRSTIQQILLSDGLDPFNRAPLKLDQITSAVELKAKIDQFIQERKARKHQATAGEPMDM